MPSYLQELLDWENAEITRNELANLTGLSNSYILALERGKITRVGRDKLISIGAAFNLPLDDINRLLLEYKSSPVTSDDVDSFLNVAHKRRIVGMQSVHRGLNLYLLFISLEGLAGDLDIVTYRPLTIFEPPGYRTYFDNKLGFTNEVFLNLKARFIDERRKIMQDALTKYKITHFICKHCMAEYIKKADTTTKEEKEFIRQHLKTTIKYITQHNYDLRLTNKCEAVLYEIKHVHDHDSRESNKIMFVGMTRHESDMYGHFLGFVTDVKRIYSRLNSEFKSLKDVAMSSSDTVQYIKNKFNEFVHEDL